MTATYSEQGREQERQQLLVEQERDRAADEGADRGEQLEGHAQAQVRDVALEVDAGRGAAGHDHADSETPTASRSGEAEAERQQRDDEDPAAEPEERAERAGGGPAAEHQQPDDHVRSGTRRGVTDGRSARPAQGRRCCGAYGSRATWRARLRATASSRWWPAHVPVLRRGSILARSDR